MGGVLVAAALKDGSTVCAIIGLALWITSFEPLLKVGVGTALGVEYDYAYLYGGLEASKRWMLRDLDFSGAAAQPNKSQHVPILVCRADETQI